MHIVLLKFEKSTNIQTTMDNIKNKTVLITGGASGLGFTYAQKMLQNGAKTVALLDLNTTVGQTAVTTLEKEFGKGKALFFLCDVSNVQLFADTFKKAATALGSLDIVINNAGLFNDAKWEQTVRVNVGGVIQGSLLAMDQMGKHKGGKGGVILNVASIVALQIYPSCPVYTASKHDVLAFSRGLKEHYPTTGVRVLVICPGVTKTALLVDATKTLLDFIDPEHVTKMLGALPVQEPDNVGEAVVKLIQKGQNGSVWVSEGEEPPFAVEFPPFKKVDITY